MIIEFEREDAEDRWLPLGVARTARIRLDVNEAVAALSEVRGEVLAAGTYRLRAVEPTPRWRYAEVDPAGAVHLLDRCEQD